MSSAGEIVCLMPKPLPRRGYGRLAGENALAIGRA
jgi:hypothetical protein